MRFDFYHGIDGATLRIESESVDELVSLRGLFDDLLNERINSSELTDTFGMRSTEVDTISIRRIPRRHFRDPEVTFALGRFEWWADPFDLARYSGLIDGLLAQPRGRAYQLLTSPEPCSITVEVTTGQEHS